MDILARVHLWPPEHCAGAEMMMEELLRALVQRGHTASVHLAKGIKAEPFVRNDIAVYPRGSADWVDAAGKADVLITHLDQTFETVRASIALRKPLVQVIHNTHPQTQTFASCKADLRVFNAEWVRASYVDYDNGIVCRPPVWRRDYTTPGNGRRVTLVNLNQAKGGLVFAMLAAMMPARQFLGVEGAYGEQLRPNLPNVLVVPHGSMPMRSVYAETAVLLMPSEYESWGRTAVEAMASGIPVVAHPTPGLRECLGEAGVYVDRDDIEAWRDAVNRLLFDHEAAWMVRSKAFKRSHELDPTDDLARFCDAVEAL